MKAKRKPLKTKYGGPLIPVPNGGLGVGNHICYWWFIEPGDTEPRTYVAIEDVEGGLDAINEYLKGDCPF